MMLSRRYQLTLSVLFWARCTEFAGTVLGLDCVYIDLHQE